MLSREILLCQIQTNLIETEKQLLVEGKAVTQAAMDETQEVI